jgi:hypothetical protein
MKTYSLSQFTFLASHEDSPQFTTTATALGLARDEWPEAFRIDRATWPASEADSRVAKGGPFYLMDIVDGQGWYTQGRGAMERTAFLTVHPE